MRHQAADRACGEQVLRHAAKGPLAKPAVTVSSGDKQVGTLILCKLDQLSRTGHLPVKKDTGNALDPVLREIGNYIGKVLLGTSLLTFLTDFDDRHACG